MVILLRIMMLLLPVVLVILWLRWRAKKNSEGGVTDADQAKMRVSLLIVIVALLGTGLALRFTDDSGSPSGRYVPARVEDGKLIEGHFVEDDEEEQQGSEEDGEDSDEDPS
jgi:hypothetical protein